MRRVRRILAVVVVSLCAAVGGLYVAVPANTTPSHGVADPILDVRRRVVGFLRVAGILDSRHLMGGDPYLPSARGSAVEEQGADGASVVVENMELTQEPVYRGVLWRVGGRYIYRTTVPDGDRSTRRALRICYANDGTRFVAGERTSTSVILDTPGTVWEVRGYVPRTANAIWVEEIDENGEVRSLDAWGDASEFWRD